MSGLSGCRSQSPLLLLFSLPGIRTGVAWELGPRRYRSARSAHHPIDKPHDLGNAQAGHTGHHGRAAGIRAVQFRRNNHNVRLLDERPRTDRQRWRLRSSAGQSVTIQPIPSCLSRPAGGARRRPIGRDDAACARRQRNGTFSDHVFAISSVSGGSLRRHRLSPGWPTTRTARRLNCRERCPTRFRELLRQGPSRAFGRRAAVSRSGATSALPILFRGSRGFLEEGWE